MNDKAFLQNLMKKKNVKQWETARYMGIGETTLVRWLREDLSNDKRELIISAINAVAAKKAEGKS